MENDSSDLWVDKYRPSKLADYVISEEIREYFEAMIKNDVPQNMTFAGTAGMGKTTLARLLVNEFGADCLFVPCATDGTLDVLRSRISEFCNAMTLDGKKKFVILDEVDSASASSANNFQMGLRTVIEAAQSDTRFILTCNFSAKVLPAILSRCPLIPLKFDKKDLLTHVKKILDAEKVSYDRDSLKAFIEESFGFYPDCRRIINYLQFCCSSGTLKVNLNKAAAGEKADFVRQVFSMISSNADLLEIRKFYLANKDKVSDFMAAGSDLMNAAIDGNYVDVDGILRLTDMLYQLNVVVDKDTGFFGMITALKKHWRT